MSKVEECHDTAHHPLSNCIPKLFCSQLITMLSKQETQEPVAIVGMGCRFSGIATSPNSLWNMLENGLTGWTNEAGERFRMEAFRHPQADISGSFNARGLHLLRQDPALFDNSFFGISNMEAKAMDPQHRMMLEIAYETFESAGVSMDRLAGSDTAVYCAASNHDYEKILGRDVEASPMYRFTGTGPSMLANRVSHSFDLRGPSVTLDTACSSGLVALNEACKAIREGEATQALVGGANLILDPDQMTVMSTLSMLSSHGRCYSFDKRANGYGRGDGVAAVLLKPLSQALRDGDTVRAVIRASGVNQDGYTPGITMPSYEAQVRLIEQVYAKAKLRPSDTPYVESHGTGTILGDQIEARALAATFCKSSDGRNVLVGSVKANLGHTESVSGLAAVIKTVMMLERGMIPSNPNFSQPNDEIAKSNWSLKIPVQLTEWPAHAKRRASVNNFGYGGTNGHVILEATTVYPPSKPNRSIEVMKTSATPRLFVLSHATESGLSTAVANLKSYVSRLDDSLETLNNLAWTLSRRSHLEYRLFFIASTRQELLDELQRQQQDKDRITGYITAPRICFVFSGQGAQWPGMASELLATSPVFAESMRRSEEILLQLGAEWHLIQEVCKPPKSSRINEAALSQPACTAIQIALVDLLQSWNVHPTSVCGHSSGEIAAAYVVGMLSAEAAMQVAYHRGRCAMKLKERYPKLKGSMLAVGLSATDIEDYLTSFSGAGTAVVACENSPHSVTLSGDASAIAAIQKQLAKDRVFNRALLVDSAYHSHHMALIREDYFSSIKDIVCSAPKPGIHMFSSIDGEEVKIPQLGPVYWCDNLTSPVRFVDAVTSMLHAARINKKDTVAIMEIGPHSALAGPIAQIIRATNQQSVEYLSILKRDQNASTTTTSAAGQLFQSGAQNLNLEVINNPCNNVEKRLLPDLPAYTWTHKAPLWSESRRSLCYRRRELNRHDILGTPTFDNVPSEPTWRNYFSLKEQPWLAGHVVGGSITFPAAGFLSMALEAVKQKTLHSGNAWKNMVVNFSDIRFESALIIAEDSTVETVTSLRPHSVKDSWFEFCVFSVSVQGDSVRHCRGSANAVHQVDKQRSLAIPGSLQRIKAISEHSHTRMDPINFYRQLRKVGLDYTGVFANNKDMRASQYTSVCSFNIPDVKSIMPEKHQQPHCIHPSTLDLCLQASFPAMKLAGALGNLVVPSSIKSLVLHSNISSKPGQELCVFADLLQQRQFKTVLDVVVQDSHESTARTFIKIEGLTMVNPGGSKRVIESSRSTGQSLTHRIQWSIDPTFPNPEAIESHCKLPQKELSSVGQNRICEEYTRVLLQSTLASLTPDDELNVKGHLVKLLQWMKNKVAEFEKVAGVFPDVNLESRVKAVGVQGEALARLAPHLRAILLGKTDGLELLMQDGLLDKMYSYDNHERGHRQLAKYVQLLQFKNPNMRILEIGAGTASTTLPVLNALAARSDSNGRPLVDRYTFTDISTGFFEKAMKKLDRFGDLVEFKKLDIEYPPGEQSIELASYDLVIAVNVVHATRDIENTLKSIRSLLKPQGHLALMEITVPMLHTGLTFGTLPGWWLSTDGRKDGPLMNPTLWNKKLRNSAFTGLDVHMPDYENAYHEISVIISSVAYSKRYQHDLAQMRVNKPRIPRIITNGRHETNGDSQSEVEDTNGAMEQQSDDVSQNSSIGQTVYIVHETSEKNIAELLVKLFGINGVNAKSSLPQYALPKGSIVVVLLELLKPYLMNCKDEQWEKVSQICQHARMILWVTSGAAIECASPMRSLVTGLARCVQSENHAIKFRTLDLESQSQLETTLEWEHNLARHICDVSQRLLNPEYVDTSTEWEFAMRSGAILIPRVVEDHNTNTYVKNSVSEFHPIDEHALVLGRPLSLNIQVPGLLDTLYWMDSARHSSSLGREEIRVQLSHLSLNFRDMMVAMGQLDEFTALLVEGSGRVMEIGEGASDQFAIGDLVYVYDFDGLATTSIIHKTRARRLPQGMNLELAAATGTAFATALYALKTVAQLQDTESLLIHSGAGAVGQAAITLAQKVFRVQNIFVTVGNEEKRNFVKEKFGIAEENIFSSRGLEFYDAILSRTRGDGVDVVLNSLSGEALHKSVQLLAPLGRFVEIGKKDLLSMDAFLEMRSLRHNVQFCSVDLPLVAKRRPELMQDILRTVLELISQDNVAAISPVTTKPISEAEEGFRLMQTGKHIGKILIEVDHRATIKVQPEKPKAPKLDPESTYLVVGGTSGLGKVILRRFADLGAKNLATLSRSGLDSQASQEIVAEMASRGVALNVYKGSVSDRDMIQRLKESCADHPIRGVVQGAMVLRDARIESMRYQDWRMAIDPKVQGTWNLHEVFGNSLDFFLLLSSSAGVIGSIGQGNYAAGNTFQDAFARYRASIGLPGYAIDIGLVEGEGYSAENDVAAEFARRQGLTSYTLEEFMAIIEMAIQNPLASVPSQSQLVCGIRRLVKGSTAEGAGMQRDDAKFSHICGKEATHEVREKKSLGQVNVRDALSVCSTSEQALEIVTETVKLKLTRLLAIPAEDIRLDRSVASYGIDSLIAIELRNWLLTALEAQVEIFELMSQIPFSDLIVLVAKRSCLILPSMFAS
ncbi:unnamed protein product [Periconia digitata]|uniref:Carrier domain-containing protein n=1 Tax=Periconia digitata TaxID=1303443 RepID=A0A9W4XUF5_9PLEO|nr:unnamed protein product [Periconia digitata]